MGVSNDSVSWTSMFGTMVLKENERRSDVTFLVQTFWTLPYEADNPSVAAVLSRIALAPLPSLVRAAHDAVHQR